MASRPSSPYLPSSSPEDNNNVQVHAHARRRRVSPSPTPTPDSTSLPIRQFINDPATYTSETAFRHIQTIMTVSRRSLLRAAAVCAGILVLLSIAQLGNSSPKGDLTQSRSMKDGWSINKVGKGMREWIPWSPGDSPSRYIGDDNDDLRNWVNFEDELPETIYEGGLPGYQVFSNLYISGSTLLAISPSSSLSSDDSNNGQRQYAQAQDPDLDLDEGLMNTQANIFPEAGIIVSKKNSGDEEKWKVVDQGVGKEEVGKRGIKLAGVTYIFNDGPGGEGYLVYFRHFVLEAFLGATRVLASTLPESIHMSIVPKRIWFPQCGETPSWRDDRGENAWFLAHALPFASIEESTGWSDRNTASLTVLLEKVVIIDRWASHSVGGEVGKWGKMNAAIPTVNAPKDFWKPFKDNVIRSLGVDGISETGSRGLPVVVYVDRQKSNPKIKDADHDKLVESLKGLTNIAEIHVARLSAMTKARQVELMSRAQVIIGLHGDELMSSLWMPAGGTIVEIFEQDGFARDYELLGSSLNHKYIAVTRNRIISEEEWRKIGTEVKGEERKNGEISLNSKIIVDVLIDILKVKDDRLISSVDSGIN